MLGKEQIETANTFSVEFELRDHQPRTVRDRKPNRAGSIAAEAIAE